MVNRPFHLATLLALASVMTLAAWAPPAGGADFTPRRDQTVAVLPFKFAVEGGLSGLGMDTDPKEAASLIREQVAVNLRQAHWTLLETTQVDAVLVNRGWSEAESLDGVDPRALGQALGADILCYGEVTRWGRHYLLVHSQAEVGAAMRLVSSKTGKVLWSNKGEKVRTAGLTKIPTGLGAVAIAPVMGMQKAFLYEISNDVARQMTSPLLPVSGEEAPAAIPPRLMAAAAQAGSEGLVASGERISVVALGEPGLTATFSVGPQRRDIPMTEFGPGRYVGSYEAASGDKFSKTPITVNLFTRAGGLATATLSSPVVTSRP
jgi:hypothetical protein